MSSMSSSSRAIGLTGGIGCGKTTVLQEFLRLGIPCFEADACGRALYEEPAFKAAVAEHFGARVLTNDGAIDRKAVADIVFHAPAALEWLNSRVHPLVEERFAQWRRQQQAPYVLFESAILYEAGLDSRFDKFITVYLEREERIRRLLLRDNTCREAIEARMAQQMSAEEKMLRADYVILNYEGNPRRRQVEHLHRLLLQPTTY